MVESRQEECLAIVGAFTVVTFLFVACRVWSRYLGRNFGWDDYLIILAIILLLADTIATWTYILLSGTGYHIWDVPKRSVHEQLVALHWNFSVQMLYHPLMGAIRASIIMFLFRMKDNRRRIRYSLHVVFWCNICYALGTSLVNLLQCTPTRYMWSKPEMDKVGPNGKTIPGGTCINSRTFVLVSCALSIFMDLIIIPIPSIMVWNLQMCRRTKILVVFVMSLGWIATGVSVGRFIVYYYRIAPTNTDRTWDIGIAISIAEPAVHIMTACAPGTKCLFRYLFPFWGSERHTTYYEEHGIGRDVSGVLKSRSRGSRGLDNFHFGFSNVDDEDFVMEPKRTRALPPLTEQELEAETKFQLHPFNTNDSMERGDVEEDGRRTSCCNTSHTEASEPTRAEPKHCLSHAR
ncbi:hypothetical protein ACN47E_006884 [Coniothyrium glycines]